MPQMKAAHSVMKECGVSQTVLLEQWELQKALQLSVRARKSFWVSRVSGVSYYYRYSCTSQE